MYEKIHKGFISKPLKLSVVLRKSQNLIELEPNAQSSSQNEFSSIPWNYNTNRNNMQENPLLLYARRSLQVAYC